MTIELNKQLKTNIFHISFYELASSDILFTGLTLAVILLSPNQPLRYTFLDEKFANIYADLTRTDKIFTSFAVLAIIIACLGLFALSAFWPNNATRKLASVGC